MGVAAEIAVVKGIAHVVEAVFQKGQQIREIEILVAGVAYLPLRQSLEIMQQGVEARPGWWILFFHG